MRPDRRNFIPIGLAAKHLTGRSAVYRHCRPAGPFHRLGNVHRIDRVPGATEPDLGRDRRWMACSHYPGNNRPDAIGVPQQVRAALRLLTHVLDRATEIEVHHAHPELLREPLTDGGKVLRIVIPDLDRQRTRLLSNPP